MNKWNVVEIVEGVKAENVNVFEAENIDTLVKQLKEKLNVRNFQYEKDEAFSTPTYTIYEPNNEHNWFVAYQD